jgi:thioredoxin-dependent peroxiredoxin
VRSDAVTIDIAKEPPTWERCMCNVKTRHRHGEESLMVRTEGDQSLRHRRADEAQAVPFSMKPGDRPPDSTLPDQNGQPVRFADLLGKGPVVVFFYPKAGSPGCTREACAFRDVHDKLVEAGATVVGISGDSVEEIAAFARERRLQYTLLSDSAAEVRGLWKVPRDFVVMPGRVTYVLDRDGVVTKVIRSAVRMEKHVAEALREIVRLRRGGKVQSTK